MLFHNLLKFCLSILRLIKFKFKLPKIALKGLCKNGMESPGSSTKTKSLCQAPREGGIHSEHKQLSHNGRKLDWDQGLVVPWRVKANSRGFQPGPTLISLYSHRRRLEA